MRHLCRPYRDLTAGKLARQDTERRAAAERARRAACYKGMQEFCTSFAHWCAILHE